MLTPEILQQAFTQDNWEPLKSGLINRTVTVGELNTIFFDIHTLPAFAAFEERMQELSIASPPTFFPTISHEYVEYKALLNVKLNAVTIASLKGRADILQLLFNFGLKMSAENSEALLQAVRCEHLEVARVLLENGAVVNYQGGNGSSPLSGAFFSEGAGDSDSDSEEDEEDEDDTHLFEMVKLLVEAGANPYLPNKPQLAGGIEQFAGAPGKSPLEYAIFYHASERIFSLLLDSSFGHGAQNTQALAARATALYRVIESRFEGYESIADMILKAGIDSNSQASVSALSIAAAMGIYPLTEKLLKLGVNPNRYCHPHQSSTALMAAIGGYRSNGGIAFRIDTQMPSFEAPSGMPREYQESWNESQIHYHRPGPHKDVIKLLLQYGAVPRHPRLLQGSLSADENAMTLAEKTQDVELTALLENCQNKIIPRTDIGSFFVYDIFDKNGVSTAAISTKTIANVMEGACVLHRGDLIIQGDVPKNTQIRVIDGNIAIHGNVGAGATIFASYMPLVRLRNGISSIIARCAIEKPNGQIELIGPYAFRGGNIQANLALLEDAEFSIPCVKEIPANQAKTGNISITGHITDSTKVIASGVASVNQKCLITESPYSLDCDTGEIPNSSSWGQFNFPSAQSMPQHPIVPPLLLSTKVVALHSRAQTYAAHVVEILEKCKMKGESAIPNPELALRRAAMRGRLDIIKKLFEVVPDLKINESGATSGKTALDFAYDCYEENGSNDTLKFLESKGAIRGKSHAAIKLA